MNLEVYGVTKKTTRRNPKDNLKVVEENQKSREYLCDDMIIKKNLIILDIKIEKYS